ncbi:hypothetical protein JCM8547_001125 [Rhodosporidiobolus lusitaniae]
MLSSSLCSTPTLTLARPTLPSIRAIPHLAAHLPPPTLPVALPPLPESRASPTISNRTCTPSEEDRSETSCVGDEEMSVEVEVEKKKKKVSSRLGRKLPNKACGPCKKHHIECAALRPCPTCVKRGRAELCVDVPSKRGNKSRARNALTVVSATLLRPTLNRSPPLPHQPFSSSSRFGNPLHKTVSSSSASLRHPLFRQSVPSIAVSSACSSSSSSTPSPPAPRPIAVLRGRHAQHSPLVSLHDPNGATPGSITFHRPFKPFPQQPAFRPPPAPLPLRRHTFTPTLSPVPSSSASSSSDATAVSSPAAAAFPYTRPHLTLLHRRSSDTGGSMARCSSAMERSGGTLVGKRVWVSQERVQ